MFEHVGVSKTLNRHQNLGKFWETDSHIIKSTSTKPHNSICFASAFYVFEATISGTETRLIHRGCVHGKPDEEHLQAVFVACLVVLHDLLSFEGNAFVSRPEDTSR